MTALHPSLAQLLTEINRIQAERRATGLFEPTATSMREALANTTHRLVSKAPNIALTADSTVSAAQLPGHDARPYAVPVRIYHPAPGCALPVTLFAHGGGHMAGGISVYEPIAKRMAETYRQVLVQLEYRLAPECPYPAGLEDLESVILGLFTTLRRFDLPFREELHLVGDSAGGALVASALHRLLGQNLAQHVRSQVLIYPSLDYTCSQPSVESNGKGYFLEADRIRWLFDRYFQDGEDRAKASPLFMPVPEKLPPTLLVSAGFCPLRDENLGYVNRLHEHGVRVDTLHFDDMIHAFMNMDDVVPEACERLHRRVATFLAGV